MKRMKRKLIVIHVGEVNEMTMYWIDLMTPFGLVLIGLATMFFWPEKK
jgi:hypothetical protein